MSMTETCLGQGVRMNSLLGDGLKSMCSQHGYIVCCSFTGSMDAARGRTGK